MTNTITQDVKWGLKMPTKKELLDVLEDAQSALDYCGDSYEREATQDTRQLLSVTIEKLKKELGIKDEPVNCNAPWSIPVAKRYKCPYCKDSEHYNVRERTFVDIGLVDHVNMVHPEHPFSTEGLKKRFVELVKNNPEFFKETT